MNFSALGLLWKQKGEGSQSALARMKRTLQVPGPHRRDIGHTGILDPFAEGLLLVGAGEATKILSGLQGLIKIYEATFCFGVTSPSFDTDSKIEQSFSEKLETFYKQSDLGEAHLKDFLLKKSNTVFDQVPPQYSSVRVDGKHAYEWARQGQQRELKARSVRLFGCRLLEAPYLSELEGKKCLILKIEVEVAAGTYIRALSRDWGLELFGVPGLVKELKRTGIGPFNKLSGELEDMDRATGLGWKTLKIEDLAPLFEMRPLSLEAAQQLRKNGLHPEFSSAKWPGREHSKPWLFVGPEPLGAVACLGDSKRVFCSNPFGLLG